MDVIFRENLRPLWTIVVKLTSLVRSDLTIVEFRQHHIASEISSFLQKKYCVANNMYFVALQEALPKGKATKRKQGKFQAMKSSHRSHIQMGVITGHVGSCLTLPKLYFATIEIIGQSNQSQVKPS